MSIYKIVVLPGDGIGPEIMKQAVNVLHAIGNKYGCKFITEEAAIGGNAIDAYGEPLPAETLEACRKSDSVLLGAVGGEKWDNLPGNKRPEAGLLGIRAGLGLFTNLRPAVIYDALMDASPLKKEIISKGVDIMVVRELTGGMYFGTKGREKQGEPDEAAYDTERYSVPEIERIADIAFKIALKRRCKVTSVDKANVLESSRLWRQVVEKTAFIYKEVELNHMYVDNAAMQLVRNPAQFDVILTSNMFGDILSDEASMITGSIGMLPSASLGSGTLGLYEPIHGSAPDIAGKDLANPIATILSVAMMLRFTFNMNEAADNIENAVKTVLDKGYRTKDIASGSENFVGTSAMGRLIIDEIVA